MSNSFNKGSDIKAIKYQQNKNDFTKNVEECKNVILGLIELDSRYDSGYNKWKYDYNRYSKKYRILYSEITSIIINKSAEDIEDTLAVLNKLLDMSANPTEYKRLVKIYDHVQLIYHQLNMIDLKVKKTGLTIEDMILKQTEENSKAIIDKLEDKVSDVEKMIVEQTEENSKAIIDELEDKVSNVEKNSISILGIFASIVVAFTAGITFNASVLANMHNVNIYKLIFVIIMISQGTLHLVHLLMNNLYRISNETKGIYPVWLIWFDIITAVILIGTFAVYQFEYSRFKLWF